MKHLFISSMLLLAIISIVGCAPKKIAQMPEQRQPEIGEADKKTATADDIASRDITRDITRDIPKEAITEKHLAKAPPSDIQPSVKELQTRIQDIYFDYDQYEIQDDAKPILKELAHILAKNSKIKVIIEGHADERGTNEYNLGLGDKRANAAKEYLLVLGISSDRSNAISYGEEKPLCFEQTEDCWAKNRRAHFVLIEGR